MDNLKGNSKLKILYLLDILSQKTDNDNGLTMTQIFDELYLKGISAERKSIYNTIDLLRSAGYNIEKRRKEDTTYHLIDNDLDFTAIKSIAYLILSAPGVSNATANRLIKGIVSKLSDEKKITVITGLLKVKRENTKDIYADIIRILDAVSDDKKISFTVNGTAYTVSALKICIADGIPYLICGSRSLPGKVDKFLLADINDVKILDRKATPLNEISGDDNYLINNLISKAIIPSPSDTYEVIADIKEESIISFIEGFIGDRLEGDAKTSKINDNEFRVTLKTKITTELVRFFYKHSDTARVIAPECLIEKLKRIDLMTQIKDKEENEDLII